MEEYLESFKKKINPQNKHHFSLSFEKTLALFFWYWLLITWFSFWTLGKNTRNTEVKTEVVIFLLAGKFKSSVLLRTNTSRQNPLSFPMKKQQEREFDEKIFVSSSVFPDPWRSMISGYVWARVVINKAINRTLQNLIFAFRITKSSLKCSGASDGLRMRRPRAQGSKMQRIFIILGAGHRL